MSLESSNYSIVLVGAMNPRIHHPTWYRHIGLLSPEREQFALKDTNTLCTQPLSQFRAGPIRVSCDEERWRIQTDDVESLGDIRRFAITAFDEKLHETPLRALGFNFSFHRTTSVPDVGKALAICFSKSGLAITELEHTSVIYQTQAKHNEHEVNTKIAPSAKDTSVIFCSFNFHYELRNEEPHFEIANRIEKQFDQNRISAERFADELVEGLKTADKGD